MTVDSMDPTLRLDPADLVAGAAEQGPNIARALRRLTARVAWLEERLCESGTLEPADLDRADEETAQLASAVLAGSDAEERLLAQRERAAYQAAVDWYEQLERERDEATRELLAIGAAAGSTTRTDPVHVHQLSRFAAAEQRLTEASDAAEGYASTARNARSRLAEDEAQRAELAETIDAGIEAAVALSARLSERLAAELDRGTLLPGWFTAELGPGPARSRAAGASGTGWFDAAVAALAYRAVYGVDDASTLLGPAPAPTGPQHRRVAHRRLRGWLARLQE